MTAFLFLPSSVRNLIRTALEEDIGMGDVTTQAIVSPKQKGRATLLAKSNLVLSGTDLIPLVWEELAALSSAKETIEIEYKKNQPDYLVAGEVIAHVVGPFWMLLLGERVLLNLFMHLSGIATLTKRATDALAGTNARILDTRKTLPGLRFLEKRAVLHGGGCNHRFQLSDGILIKDNHIAACGGSVKEAISRVYAHASHLLKIECEIQRLDQIEEAICAGADILLLDNMDEGMLAKAVQLVAGRAQTEASGNMTLERLPSVAATGVDFISMGALTHSAPAADISMKIQCD